MHIKFIKGNLSAVLLDNKTLQNIYFLLYTFLNCLESVIFFFKESTLYLPYPLVFLIRQF